ncbi:hypothetical protein RI367_004677 [Sorochytrium milnesiophthora]
MLTWNGDVLALVLMLLLLLLALFQFAHDLSATLRSPLLINRIQLAATVVMVLCQLCLLLIQTVLWLDCLSLTVLATVFHHAFLALSLHVLIQRSTCLVPAKRAAHVRASLYLLAVVEIVMSAVSAAAWTWDADAALTGSCVFHPNQDYEAVAAITSVVLYFLMLTIFIVPLFRQLRDSQASALFEVRLSRTLFTDPGVSSALVTSAPRSKPSERPKTEYDHLRHIGIGISSKISLSIILLIVIGALAKYCVWGNMSMLPLAWPVFHNAEASNVYDHARCRD